jgi:hypothetical protein
MITTVANASIAEDPYYGVAVDGSQLTKKIIDEV